MNAPPAPRQTPDRRNLPILLLVPICVVIAFVHLDSARGAYFHAYNSDPEYAYLFNSLKLSEFKSPSHIDHPGTPLQFIGGLYIGTANIANTHEATRQDVINNPEYYISLLNMLLVATVAGTTLMIGVISFKLTGKALISLILQASLFCSPHIYHELVRFRPENLIIAITYLFCVPIVAMLKFPIHDYLRKYLIAFALITGLGIATKIVFIPLAIIPIILIPRLKNKGLYVLLTILSFLFFTIPIWSRFPGFFSWCFRLLTRSGRYGGGETGFVDATTFFQNILSALLQNPVFALVLLSSVLFIAFCFTKSPSTKQIREHFHFRVLLALVVAQILQIAMVSKHFSPHYLLPGLMLTGTTLVYLISGARGLFQSDAGRPQGWVIATACAGFTVFTIFGIQQMATEFDERRKAAEAVIETMNRYPEHDKVYHYRASSMAYALFFGNSFAGSEYGAQLNGMFPGHYFYNVWGGAYSDFARGIVMEDYIKNNPDRLTEDNPDSFKVVFQGASFEQGERRNALRKPDLNLIDVHSGRDETVYLLKLD